MEKIVNIKTWPDSALSKKCAQVIHFDERLINILEEMKDILKEEKALGLAAPQINVLEQIFIIKLKNEEILEVINPTIIEENEEQYGSEGCLSFIGITVTIKRPKSIHFKYQDRFGQEKEALVYDLEAREFAHEYDHLYGKTILNKVNRQERKRILKQLGL